MKELKYSRWHRYDSNNVKYIVKCDVDKHPIPLEEKGFTEWKRGTGPHTELAYNNVVNGVRKACKGVPKPQSTKDKMRLAKLGKPKSEQHRESMRLSHKLRRKAKNERLSDNSIQVQEQKVGTL